MISGGLQGNFREVSRGFNALQGIVEALGRLNKLSFGLQGDLWGLSRRISGLRSHRFSVQPHADFGFMEHSSEIKRDFWEYRKPRSNWSSPRPLDNDLMFLLTNHTFNVWSFSNQRAICPQLTMHILRLRGLARKLLKMENFPGWVLMRLYSFYNVSGCFKPFQRNNIEESNVMHWTIRNHHEKGYNCSW